MTALCFLLAWLLLRSKRAVGWWIAAFWVAGFGALSFNASLSWREAGRQVERHLESLTPIVSAHPGGRVAELQIEWDRIPDGTSLVVIRQDGLSPSELSSKMLQP